MLEVEAAAPIRFHPVTGSFTDHPSRESAFAGWLFRLAFPLHLLLLALGLAIVIGMVLSVTPALRPLWYTVGLVGIFGVVSAAAHASRPPISNPCLIAS